MAIIVMKLTEGNEGYENSCYFKVKDSKDFWAMPRTDDPKGFVLGVLIEEREGGR